MDVRAIVVDFDGTACADDVGYELLKAFGAPGWRALDEAFERQEIGSRACIVGQASLLDRDDDEMLVYALERFAMADTFPSFVRWAGERDVLVAVASDGFGFHVEPLLRAAGLGGVPVFTNRVSVRGGAASTAFPNEHPTCRTCGTCKMSVVQRYRRRGPVAFVGDGFSDRLGALYADIVFATGDLAGYCTEQGVPFLPWDTFDDVRASLEGLERLPGPVETEPERCPGWSLSPTEAAGTIG
jgi:2-hydroxy-3-keto-5-methylthiopentenyl-1-phosphate phosphatase